MSDEILRLHTDADGHVWHGSRGTCATQTCLIPEEFVNTPIFRGARYVRVLGTEENARLIVQMHEARVRMGGKRPEHIYLGSPVICYRQALLADPAFVLQQLWQPPPPAMLPGCWHELSSKDFPTYYMLAAFQTNGGVVDETVRRVAEYHPAYAAMTFPASHDLEAACRLVCLIRDPRWFSHHDRPNRANRLMAYLGLTPTNFRALDGVIPPQSNPACRNWDRAETVLRAWSGWQPLRTGHDHPRNFLWRIHRQRGSLGLLRASQAYIQFLRLVWLQGLAPPGREVFVPSIFFKDAEVEAYCQHSKQVTKTT